MTLVSVILPAWNCAEHLPKAVGSILKQTYTELELIVVDDGSTDGTAESVAGISDSRLKVIRIEHTGIVGALNVGINAAPCTLIARMDADDYSYPTRIEKQVALLENQPELGLVGCCVEYGGDREAQAGYARYVDWTNSLTEPDQIAMGRFIESPFAHPTLLFRKELVDKFGGYRDGPFPEDYELILRYLTNGVQMAKVPEPLVRWNDWPGRLSRSDERYSVDAFYRTKAHHLANWLTSNNPHHPNVVIWGAGRTTRKRADMLKDCGVKIVGYIDVDPKKTGTPIGGIPRYHHRDMPGPDEVFVLTYVANHGAREENYDLLSERGFVEGKNFIQCA